MFTRMYILSFLRNILIFLFITPMLNFYMVSLTYRVPNLDKEKILTYIVTTGDLSVLKSPVKEYNYFYAIVNEKGEIEHISDTTMMLDEKKRFLEETVTKDFHGKSRQSFYNVVPEDSNFHHLPVQEYYFSSKRVYDQALRQTVYHVIYNYDDITFNYNMTQSNKANTIAMLGASLISLFFAYLEVRPTKIAWNNQKQFIANTSHELRTPLAVINSVLELNKKDPSDIENNNNIIQTEMVLLSNIVNDLMFLSRTDAKQIKVKKEATDIYTLLLEAYIAAEVLAGSKSIIFEDFRCDEVTIYADEKLISQLVKILLSNAIIYTHDGGRVSLSCHKMGSKIEIIVADNGIGIAKEDQKQIFTRFYRVDKSQTDNKGNSGLGLSIAKWIVKKHRGTIRVESSIGFGSKFIVRLPINRGI